MSLSLTASHWYGLYSITLGGTSNTRSTVCFSNWLMLSRGQLGLPRPQLYTNMHAKKQRQEVEDSCLNFYPDCKFFCVHEANYHKKTSEKVTRNVIICSADISLIHTRRSYDFDLQLAARSEVKFSCRTGTRYLYESGCPITPGLRSKPSSWRTVSVFFIRWRSLSYSTIDSKQDAETAFLISLYSDYLQKLNFTPKEAEFLPKQAVTLIGIPPWLLERQ